MEPRCRICGCTWNTPCNPPCSWARTTKGEGPICSTCDAFRGVLDTFIERTGVKRAGLLRLWEETGDLHADDRAVLTKAGMDYLSSSSKRKASGARAHRAARSSS